MKRLLETICVTSYQAALIIKTVKGKAGKSSESYK